MKPARGSDFGAGGTPGANPPGLNASKQVSKRSGGGHKPQLRRAHIALVHVAKHQVGMAEDIYRAMLLELGGVASSTELDLAGFVAVMDRFKTLGFVNSKGLVPGAIDSSTRLEGMASAKQLALVRGLWQRWHGTADARALRHWLEGRYRVSDLRFADAVTAQKAIEGLKAMLARKPAKTTKRADGAQTEGVK